MGCGVRLEIVVAGDCAGCEEARLIARDIHQRFPTVCVELIDVGGPRALPAAVVATPTYLLDGQVIALGNPRREELSRRLVRRLAQRATSPGRTEAR